jgi:putative addiction module component (TIGR02574 family)
MLSNTLAALLKLPAKDRIELAMALWESLTDDEREAELVLTPEQEAELDRRLEEHLANPGSAIPWEEVRRKLARALPQNRPVPQKSGGCLKSQRGGRRLTRSAGGSATIESCDSFSAS